MNPNSKRQTNRLQCAALLRWVVIVVFLGGAGLSYLELKKQLYVLGVQRTHMERELHDLIAHNNVLEVQVSDLTSPMALQRQLGSGFLKMVPISEHAIALVHVPEPTRWAAADASGNQFQTVSHESVLRR